MTWQRQHDYFIEKRMDIGQEEEDIVSVRHSIVIGGYSGCVGICFFAIMLVVLATQVPNTKQEAKYISEGMEAHCGWSVVALGSCSFLLFVSQLVAGIHMREHNTAIAFSLLQMLGWCIVLGIADTGWNLHYAGLHMFLVGNIGYHWMASRDARYGGFAYQWASILTIVFTCVFISSAAASMWFREERELKAGAVALEFVLLFFTMLQNLCLVRALDAYENIHLVFEKKR